MSKIEVISVSNEEIAVRHIPSGFEFQYRIGPASRQLLNGPVRPNLKGMGEKMIAEAAYAYAVKRAEMLGML